jgi:hypothetical protein
VLNQRVEIEATREQIARAVTNAAHGESTLLACRGRLSVREAAALAEQQRLVWRLESAVRISAGHGRIHIQPRDVPTRRRILRVPGGLDRRSAFDRRVGERRALPAEDPVALAAIELHGERRTGTDRRSGGDRRRPSSR